MSQNEACNQVVLSMATFNALSRTHVTLQAPIKKHVIRNVHFCDGYASHSFAEFNLCPHACSAAACRATSFL